MIQQKRNKIETRTNCNGHRYRCSPNIPPSLNGTILYSCLIIKFILNTFITNNFRKDRNSFWGGILVYISNSLSVSRRTDLEPANIECIWIEMSDPTGNFLLCCTYRPPNSDKYFWRNLLGPSIRHRIYPTKLL